MAIQRFHNAFPKHLQVRELLLRRLERDFRIGDQFPTEKELSDQFGVSRDTVREALAWIEDQGLITRHRGQGTFVAKTLNPVNDRRLTGLTDDAHANGVPTEGRILEHGPINAPAEVATALGVEPGKLIYHVVRLSLFERRPLALHESYLSLEHGVQIARKEMRHGSVMLELEHSLGLEFWESYQRIEAVVADTAMAGLLEVRLGAPLLLIRRLHVEAGDKPLVAFHSYYRSDRYYFSAKVDRTMQSRACTDTKLMISATKARNLSATSTRSKSISRRRHTH